VKKDSLSSWGISREKQNGGRKKIKKLAWSKKNARRNYLGNRITVRRIGEITRIKQTRKMEPISKTQIKPEYLPDRIQGKKKGENVDKV